jgi:hypothetical protein
MATLDQATARSQQHSRTDFENSELVGGVDDLSELHLCTMHTVVFEHSGKGRYHFGVIRYKKDGPVIPLVNA